MSGQALFHPRELQQGANARHNMVNLYAPAWLIDNLAVHHIRYFLKDKFFTVYGEKERIAHNGKQGLMFFSKISQNDLAVLKNDG